MAMTSGLGSSFSPNDPQKKTAMQGTPIQQALQILSLHLPRVLGAGAPAPRELLAAGGQFRPAPNVTGLVGPPATGSQPPAFQGPPVPAGFGGQGGAAGAPGFQFGTPPGQMPGPPQYLPGMPPHPMIPPTPGPSAGPPPVPFNVAEFQRRMQEWQAQHGYQGGSPPSGPPMRNF